MTPLEILRAVRAELADPRHWIKGSLADDQGGLCVIGAFRRVSPLQLVAIPITYDGGQIVYTYGFGHEPEARQALVLFRSPNGIESIPDWNDAPERTHGEVLAAFDRAIILAESLETPVKRTDRTDMLEPFPVLPSGAPSAPYVEEFPRVAQEGQAGRGGHRRPDPASPRHLAGCGSSIGGGKAGG